jgi:hypothetical protein
MIHLFSIQLQENANVLQVLFSEVLHVYLLAHQASNGMVLLVFVQMVQLSTKAVNLVQMELSQILPEQLAFALILLPSLM